MFPSGLRLFRLLALCLPLLLLLAAPATAARRLPTVFDLTIGFSTEGRPISAVRIGDGPRKLVLVGATHGEPEANTYRLMLDLVEHFRDVPEEVPSTVRLYIIPSLNPDGLALGTRLNARGVDLNRNMNTGLDACPENDWSPTVYGAYGILSETGGPAPETEVESRLIRAFLLDASAAIFYHSAGGELFPPYCSHAPSIALAQRYAEAAGYTYTRYYPRYLITGGMHDWAGSLGIASFTPELWTGEGSDTEANHAALHAILTDAETLLPLIADTQVGASSVPTPIWRFWRSMGGAERLGFPINPPTVEAGRTIQRFTRAVITLDSQRLDTPAFVQLAPLGEHVRSLLTPASRPTSDGLAQVYESLFSSAIMDLGGEDLLGAPLAPPEMGIALNDGSPRVVQYFTRARLELDPAAQMPVVSLSPVGWYDQQLAALVDPTFTHQIR